MADGATPVGEVVLETDRSVLRPWRVAEAALQRELRIERDPRVPPHRRIDADGYPTVADLEAWIRINQPSSGYERVWATVWNWKITSRRVLAKLGFTETDRTEVDPVRGTNLSTMQRL